MKLGELRKLTSNLSDDYEIVVQTYEEYISTSNSIYIDNDRNEIVLYEKG